ncbi:glycosyltransferase family 4 protein [Candidatus Pacearchaeota archaeon]|nr:glycosyltransferase family 4 protein [Candidatus Pacearchaeota archaeon]
MKVLIVTHYFQPHVGGIEIVAYNQAKELVKQGHEVTIVSSKIGDEKEREIIDGIKIIRVKAWNFFEKKFGIPYPVFSLRLIKVLNDEVKKAEVINLHGHVYFSSVIGAHICKKLEKSFVLTQHNNYIYYKNPIFNFMEFVVDKILGKYVLSSAKEIIVISNQTKQYVQSIIKKSKKISIIYNGIDLEKFKSLKNIKQKNNVILFTGRFIDWKGIKELINIAKQLSQYEFWFAGQGHLVNLINLPNTKNLGYKTQDELVRLYNKATICVFPSWHEPFGLVGLEAMSCGKSVIATPLGFSEYIENGKDGIIIPAKDEKALKNAIVDLIRNPKKRKTIEKNARKKALNYSWDKNVRRLLEVYRR